MIYVLDFIKTYYKEIIVIGCNLIVLIVYLLRRKNSVNLIDSIKKDILEILPSLISKVEVPGRGPDKLNAVLEATLSYLRKVYKLKDPVILTDYIKESIEEILSTPSKKGE